MIIKIDESSGVVTPPIVELAESACATIRSPPLERLKVSFTAVLPQLIPYRRYALAFESPGPPPGRLNFG
ncbi:MAG TPA: hypothetical protein VJX23_06825 [Candidatus Binataceae bacterium]|nr:hypothetical protein [Candidatus Binataceae bacterium]